MYDKVIVAVVNLPWRKGKTRVQRRGARAFVQSATRELVNVDVEPFSTLLVDFARERGAMAIVKGLRAISDFEYELEMNQLNRRQDPEIESVYLMASAKYSFLELERHQGTCHVRRGHRRSGPRTRWPAH